LGKKVVKNKRKFKKVAIVSNSSNKNVIEIAHQCLEVLESQGIKLYLTKELNSLGNKYVVGDRKIIKEADLLISIGGDGSMLSNSRRFGFKGIPILGINLGNVGFLTDIAPENITTSLTEVINGEYEEDSRFFLEANINADSKKYIALNEVVIHSGAVAQLIEFELYVNEDFVYRQRADGLIISTPTGSTAYSLSGGGPIIHPNVKALALLPMFPHSLSSSPLLVDDSSEIIIKIVGKNNKSTLSMDSHDSVNLKKGDEVTLSKASSHLTLIHPTDHNFYFGCRNKLGWSANPIDTVNE